MENMNKQEDYNPLANNLDIDRESDDAVDLSFQDVMYERCFIGDTPFKTILESLENQFNDYINLDDKTNYVDLFYDQMKQSYEHIQDVGIDIDEYKEILDKILQEFYDFIKLHFEQRLMITITELYYTSFNKDRIDYIIRKLYKYFILNARKNFFKLITTDISSKIKTVRLSDDDFYNLVSDMLTQYSPLIRSVGPLEFLRLTDGEEIAELLENNEICGNYLRKYSPRLYKNKDFEVEIINEIIMNEDNNKEENKEEA